MTEDGRRILSRQNNGENEAQQKSNTDGKFFIFFFYRKIICIYEGSFLGCQRIIKRVQPIIDFLCIGHKWPNSLCGKPVALSSSAEERCVSNG